jgi:hypothetical protein
MRLALLLAILVLVGCSAKRPSEKSTLGLRHVPPSGGATVSRTNAAPITVTPAPGTVYGKVAYVNPAARFLVLTYPIGKLPPIEKRLSVYRNGMKVAELKVTGPARDQNTVADITAGEAQPGDEVRDF